MLGVLWVPETDVFRFTVRINLTPLKNKVRTGPDVSRSELSCNPPQDITRRQFYSQIQSLFDPIGFLAPVLLQAKILLRKTWEGDLARLKWDDPLPKELVHEMVEFFLQLYDVEDLEFQRSLWPKENVVGKPELIVFSDGSVLSF